MKVRSSHRAEALNSARWGYQFTMFKHPLWIEWRGLIIFLIVMVLFRSAVADWNQVPTGSMKPTILDGDRVVVNKLAYRLRFPLTDWELARWSAPERGDIITFYSPLDEKLLIKRVIGLPGDQIELNNNTLIINGEPCQYSRLDDALVASMDRFQRARHRFFYEHLGTDRHPVMLQPGAATAYNSFNPIKIPRDEFLVLGDNRDNSRDSRMIGLVPLAQITGRAYAVAFSVDYDNYYLPRLDRFFHSLEAL
jgi:signal peptidase I